MWVGGQVRAAAAGPDRLTGGQEHLDRRAGGDGEFCLQQLLRGTGFWKIVLLLMYGRGLGFWGSPNSRFFYDFSVL